MIKKTLFTLLLLTVLFSCKKHRLRGDREALEGKWEWIFTVRSNQSLTNGTTYKDTIFPSDVTSWYSVEFKKSGKVHFLENGEILNKYRLVFAKFQEPGAITPLFVNNGTLYEFNVKLNNEDKHSMVGFVSSDSLRFIERDFPFENESNSGSILVHVNYFKIIE